jgi:hypothetical protein
MATAVPIFVEELRGEPGDPDEANINLVLDKSGVPDGAVTIKRVDVAPGLSFLVVSTDTTGEALVKEELRGEPDDPTEANAILVAPKATVGVAAHTPLQGTLYTRTGGSTLLIELPEGV